MKNKKAFTLIELLVVIAIIGLLATIVLVSVGSLRADARDAKRIADLKALQKAVELYFVDNGVYPEPCLGYQNWSGHSPDFGNCDTNYIKNISSYIANLPIDPKDTGGYGYLYRSSGPNYSILAHGVMETVCDGVDADTTPDPGDECNPPEIRQLDRISYEQPTISVYSPGGKTW